MPDLDVKQQEVASQTPADLIPSLTGVAVREPTFYRSLYILESLPADKGGQLQDPPKLGNIDAPLDPFDEANDGIDYFRPAVGVLTVHKQQWEQQGIALGNLVNSICLAPGEITQVAMVDWQRSTTGTSTQSTEQSEQASSDIEQARAVNEIQEAIASETQQGASSTSASSSSGQAGVSFGSLFMSGSASAAHTSTSALTAQFSSGLRNLAAESSNSINERTAEKASSLRSRRATVVREVSERESEKTTSRVIANYNRRHSLNIEYFEVVQLYGISTHLTEWERCLFLPLKPLDFTSTHTIEKHKIAIEDILSKNGYREFLDVIDTIGSEAYNEKTNSDIHKEIDNLVDKLKQETEKNAAATVAFSNIPLTMVKDNQIRANAVRGLRKYWEGVSDRTPSDIPAGDIESWTVGELVHRTEDRFKLLNKEIQRIGSNIDQLKRILRIRRSGPEKYLNDNQLWLSQQIWLRTGPFEFYKMLSQYELEGKALADMVDPHPVGVFGNMVAFRWSFRDATNDQEAFRKKYMGEERNITSSSQGNSPHPNSITVAVPTSGVFAEAVLGRAEAAEIRDDARQWSWQTSDQGGAPPILPPHIAEITSRDRGKGVDLSAADLSAALASLRAERISDISHINALADQIGKGDMFRDMGGLAEAATLADKVSALSSKGASDAGQRAVDLQGKLLDTFVKVLDSDVGKAAVSEFMLPGSGALLLKGDSSTKPGNSAANEKARKASPARPPVKERETKGESQKSSTK